MTDLHEQVICAAAGVKCNATNYPGTDLPKQAIIDAAQVDPSLVHQVKAPAGSTLVFYE